MFLSLDVSSSLPEASSTVTRSKLPFTSSCEPCSEHHAEPFAPTLATPADEPMPVLAIQLATIECRLDICELLIHRLGDKKLPSGISRLASASTPSMVLLALDTSSHILLPAIFFPFSKRNVCIGAAM